MSSHEKQQHLNSKATENSTPATNNRIKLQHCCNSKQRNNKTKKRQKMVEEEIAYLNSLLVFQGYTKATETQQWDKAQPHSNTH